MKREIWAIQSLRGFAAAMVVLHHAIRAFAAKAESSSLVLPQVFTGSGWNFLILGVDLFFVISGFIMVHTTVSQRGIPSAHRFLARRAVRIFPMYWIALAIPLLGALVAYLKSGRFDAFTLDPARVISSILLFPSLNIEGKVQPILGVGWTLSYELLFYAAFTVAIAVGRRPVVVASSLLILTLLGGKVVTSPSALGVFLADPIYLEFIFGMILGALHNAGKLSRLPIWAGAAALGAAVFVAMHFPEESHWRFLWAGLPAALIIWSAISYSTRPAESWAEVLGAASYPTYLFHMTVIYWVVLKPVISLGIGLSHPLLIDLYIAGAVVLSLVAGYALHRIVERPLQDLLNRRHQALAAKAAAAEPFEEPAKA